MRDAPRDIIGSIPRMSAGAIAMNIPAIKQSYELTGEISPELLGETSAEIVSNIFVGMVFSKHGKSFMSKGGGRRFGIEHGELRKSYATDLENLNKINLGLDIMGWPIDGNLRKDSVETSAFKSALLKDSQYAELNEILSPYIDDSAPTRKTLRDNDLHDIRTALTKYMSDNNIKYNSPEYIELTKKLTNLETILSHYTENMLDRESTFRHVTPDEAKSLVETVNNSNLLYSAKNQSLTEYLSNLSKKAKINVDTKYMEIRRQFLVDF